MGGTLDLVATFPNTKPVKIVHIGDLADSEQLEDDAPASIRQRAIEGRSFDSNKLKID